LRMSERPVSPRAMRMAPQGRFRAGVREAPACELPAPRELLGNDDRVFGGRREVGAVSVTPADRRADRRMGVALQHRAEAVVEVEELVAVDIPDALTLASGQIDRPGVTGLKRRSDPARQHPSGAPKHRGRPGRALVQRGGFALAQLADPPAIQHRAQPFSEEAASQERGRAPRRFPPLLFHCRQRTGRALRRRAETSRVGAETLW
jgi:hypothetical protein